MLHVQASESEDASVGTTNKQLRVMSRKMRVEAVFDWTAEDWVNAPTCLPFLPIFHRRSSAKYLGK